MRVLVWLLLLLNVGLVTYFNWNLIMPKPVQKAVEVEPDKIKLLTEETLATMPKKEAVVQQPESQVVTEPSTVAELTTCYRWGNFTATNLPSAQVVLVKLGLQSQVRQEPVSKEDRRFWVYYPPLKSAELAQQKAAEIKALGVEELFIVQDSQWRNSISFGLFQDEQLASNLLKDLQEKGVKGATKALRSTGNAASSLLISGVSASAALELQKVKPEFLGTDLQPAACQ